MPFYALQPEFLEVRSEFYTSYPTSSLERKANIKLACGSLNNTLVDVGGEFSFNRTVGVRSKERGYQKAKIIVGGVFTEGYGGGVCQVSTTLYNAILLAGLKITEYHPHSLPVNYVAPSFDAMVNSGSADLRFINNTKNPIIIKCFADGSILKVVIYGQPMQEKYVRQSTITQYVDSVNQRTILDTKGEYPNLYKGETLVLQYAKPGYVSQGVLIKTINGKVVSSKTIRNDVYKPVDKVIIQGNAERDGEQ